MNQKGKYIYTKAQTMQSHFLGFLPSSSSCVVALHSMIRPLSYAVQLVVWYCQFTNSIMLKSTMIAVSSHINIAQQHLSAFAAIIADIFPTLSPRKVKRAQHHASAFAAIIAVIFLTICSNRYNNLVLYENSELTKIAPSNSYSTHY